MFFFNPKDQAAIHLGLVTVENRSGQVDGQWHTWIDYNRFHELVRAGGFRCGMFFFWWTKNNWEGEAHRISMGLVDLRKHDKHTKIDPNVGKYTNYIYMDGMGKGKDIQI